jgi:hypothetical protein
MPIFSSFCKVSFNSCFRTHLFIFSEMITFEDGKLATGGWQLAAGLVRDPELICE